MAWTDLRSFLSYLEHRGDLLSVPAEVHWEYEAAALTRRVSDFEGPALMFERIRDADYACLSGLFAAKRRVAWALETGEDGLFKTYQQREECPIAPKLIERPPCQEIVLTGDEINLGSLPILRHYERDAGRYVTAGLQVAKDPELRTRNVSIHRLLLLGHDLMTVFAPPGRHLRTIIERCHERGQQAEIATVIGAEPATQIASQARTPFGVDEFHVAGGLRREPLELTRCASIDVEVPATAEMIIEGRTVPGRMEMDGPFGEYPGTYSEGKEAPVLQVTAITMRSGAFYQNTLTGTPMTENHWMMQPAAAAMALREARKVAPEIHRVNVTRGGAARHHVVVSMSKRHPSEARNVMLALLAAPLGAKQVIVVDGDIDVDDMLQVEWAVNTRVQPDHDVLIVPNLYSPTLDPSAPHPRASAKMGIDATMPVGEKDKYAPPQICGIDEFTLERHVDIVSWRRPEGVFR